MNTSCLVKMNRRYPGVKFLLLVCGITLSGAEIGRACTFIQYLSFGSLGTITCPITENALVVSWYNSTNYVNDYPIIYLSDSIKGGVGYDSGEYDILLDGSLVVNNVSMKHEGIFTLSVLYRDMNEPIVMKIKIIVTVSPSSQFPVIQNCKNRSRICFERGSSLSLVCSVENVRPSVNLKWLSRTAVGDEIIPYRTHTFDDGIKFSTEVTTMVTPNDTSLPSLLLLVCKAESSPQLLLKSESLVLTQRYEMNFLTLDSILQGVTIHSNVRLVCAVNSRGYCVWRRKRPADISYEDIGYSINFAEKYTEVFSTEYNIDEENSLIIAGVQIELAGLYSCIFSDGTMEQSILHQVVVNVPVYPKVEGCKQQVYCVLEVKHEGSLTCTLMGVWDRVEPLWVVYSPNDAAISFQNDEIYVHDNGHTFDVTLRSDYHIFDKSANHVTIECSVPELNVSTKVELLPMKDTVSPRGSIVPTQLINDSVDLLDFFHTLIILVTAVAAGIGIGILVTWIYQRKRRKRYKEYKYKKIKRDDAESSSDENISLQRTKSITLEDITCQFVEELKKTYHQMCNAVKPIPYMKDTFSVIKVFTETRMELFDSKEGHERWEQLDTHHDIFHGDFCKFEILIIEGEPGYGKSTLTLKFAHDWCNPKPESHWNSIYIFILLRMGQLRNVKSVYKAIQRQLLSKDSSLREADIKNILQNCKSVLLMLDGYDEYPHQDSNFDINDIISRKLFRNFQVVVTTRSCCLPSTNPSLTKRLRLTGFDQHSRRKYIENVVGENNIKFLEKIEHHLMKNPILCDLLQVPLLFVLFAHMTHEDEDFQKITSVTNFFRYTVSCFYSHCLNKVRDSDPAKIPSLVNNHHKLDEIAYNGLKEHHKKIVWPKEEIVTKIGQEVYKQYVQMGILVEEEVKSSVYPCTIDSDKDPCTTNVRFFHQLFCEWHAAHFVSKHCLPSTLKELLNEINPCDVQYVYRFACGLNATCAQPIINYLKSLNGGDRFAVLCTLEQTENFDVVKETIRQVCQEGVIFGRDDSCLLQRSTTQLLDLAAKCEIRIRLIGIYYCLESIDLTSRDIVLTSKLRIPSTIPVEDLTLAFMNKILTREEVADILKFSSLCPKLKELWFLDCVPPESLKAPRGNTLDMSFKVKWRLQKTANVFIFDFDFGKWKHEDTGKHLTNDEFKMLKRQNEVDGTTLQAETLKDRVKNTRETLRNTTQIDTSEFMR